MIQDSPGVETDGLKVKVESATKKWHSLVLIITKRVEEIEEVVTLCEKFEEEFEIVITFVTVTVKRIRDIKPVSYDEELIVKEQENIKV